MFVTSLTQVAGSHFTNEEQKKQRERERQTERKKLGSLSIECFATHLGLARNIIDTDCWAQHGRTNGRVFETFKHRFLTKRTRNPAKTTTTTTIAEYMFKKKKISFY